MKHLGYSDKNIKILIEANVAQIGIQTPGNAKHAKINLSEEDYVKLSNRRSGIEALIGQAKQGGQLGRSRMKNDPNTEAAAYAAVLGLNLRQTKRGLLRKLSSTHAPPPDNLGVIF